MKNKREEKFIEISGKLYLLFKARKSLDCYGFVHKDGVIVIYDPDRDGPILDKSSALAKYPEYFV